jgi:hypothetical protein
MTKYTFQDVCRIIGDERIVCRAIELGALLTDSAGLISETELDGFIREKFKHHRYNNGKRKAEAKS